MTRPRPVRSHQHSQLIQNEHFFQNGSLAWRYGDDHDDKPDDDGGGDARRSSFGSEDAPAYMDVGHFRWFWPWGVRRSSTFDTMPAGRQRLPAAATMHPGSIRGQQCLLFTRLPPELRRKIWTMVLQTQCSRRWAYSLRSPAWRPDRTGAPFIDAAVLRTCRAAYMEAWDLPMRLTQAVLADGTPQDKPGEWAPVVLSAGVLVPHAWQVLLLGRAEVTMQHFRLEAGFLDMWVAALGKLKAAAAVCIADLVAEEGRRGRWVNGDVVRKLRERQAVEEVVVRMNRMDWWTWTSVPPGPWPEELPGECVADIRDVGRSSRRRERRRRERRRARERARVEEERERQRRMAKEERSEDADEECGSGMETDEEFTDDEARVEADEAVQEDEEMGDASYSHVPPSDIASDDLEEGGYFSDSSASSAVYIFDAATLPEQLCVVPFKTDSWDRTASYGVLSPDLRLTLMLETFGPKSLQLDETLADIKGWRLPMPLTRARFARGEDTLDIRAGSAVEDGSRVLAWDGRPVREYHWLRDVGDEEAEEAAFLKMNELKGTAEGVVVKMVTLAPTSL